MHYPCVPLKVLKAYEWDRPNLALSVSQKTVSDKKLTVTQSDFHFEYIKVNSMKRTETIF